MRKRSPLSRRLMALGLGILFFAGIELGLRVFGVADGSSYAPPRLIQVVKDGQIQGEMVQQATPYFEALNTNQRQTASVYRQGNGDGFPASGSMRQVRFTVQPEKPRYFVLGGSAALGQNPVNLKIKRNWKTVPLGKQVRALEPSLAISGQIKEKMQTLGKDIEVLNIGMIAQDSGGVRRIAMEALEYDPSGLLLYLGNNEGIGLAYGMQGEQLPMVPEVRNVLYALRSFRILSDWIQPVRQRHSLPPAPLKGTKPEVLGRLTQTQWRAAGKPLMDDNRPTDSVHGALVRRFEENIRAIVEAANEKNVAVYIVPTAPHLGYPPFYDANDPALLESEMENYTQLIGTAKTQLTEQQWTAAETTLTEALDYDQTHATAWYLLAQSLNGQGRYEEMLNAAETALKMDLSRKRSLSDFADAAETVCAELGCQTTSPIPRMNTLLKSEGLSAYDSIYGDHEHLTPEGCSMVADIFVDLMKTDQY